MTKPKTPTKSASKKTAPAAAEAEPTSGATGIARTPKPPSGKLAIVASMVSTPEGATIAQLAEATGWQTHSVRGAIAGALKRKHGLNIISEKTDSGRFYRVAQAQA